MDPIRPITRSIEGIPPVVAATRLDRVDRRRRDPREGEEEQHEPEQDDDETPPDDEHPHVDVSA